jgi:hypothetical protein
MQRYGLGSLSWLSGFHSSKETDVFVKPGRRCPRVGWPNKILCFLCTPFLLISYLNFISLKTKVILILYKYTCI